MTPEENKAWVSAVNEATWDSRTSRTFDEESYYGKNLVWKIERATAILAADASLAAKDAEIGRMKSAVEWAAENVDEYIAWDDGAGGDYVTFEKGSFATELRKRAFGEVE